MVNLYGRTIDRKRLQHEMNAVGSRTSALNQRGLKEDLKTLRSVFKGENLSTFIETSNHIELKWSVSDNRARAQIAKAVGQLLLEADQQDLAREYFQKAHSLSPQDSSILINLAECEVLLGNITSARDMFREAFVAKQTVHTAAKYAEILFLTGEDRENIKTIINPFLGESVNVMQPKRSQVAILALNFVLADKTQVARQFNFLNSHNGFKDPEKTLGAVKQLVMNFLDYDSEVHIDLAKQRYSKQQAEITVEDADEKIDPLIMKLIQAYANSNRIWTGVYGASPASGDDKRAASTKGVGVRLLKGHQNLGIR